jgi:6-phosphogluconate dehydrogenase
MVPASWQAAETISLVEPVLRDLAVEGGWVHAGGPGAGHFVKLVHNGIEFAMLQAIGEGVDLLEHFHERLPIAPG